MGCNNCNICVQSQDYYYIYTIIICEPIGPGEEGFVQVWRGFSEAAVHREPNSQTK